MKQLNAIEIEGSDFLPGTENKHWQVAMTDEARAASLTADLVLYRGQIIKNRHGLPTASIEALRPPPPIKAGDTIKVRGQTIRVGEVLTDAAKATLAALVSDMKNAQILP